MTELEERWRDVGGFIREQRRLGELSLRRLSELAGVSNPYLSQIERGLRKPSAEILRQIASALHISAETLYVRAGILEDRPDQIDVATAIRHDISISDEQKRTLIHIYDSFRIESGKRTGRSPVEPADADAALEQDDDADPERGGDGAGAPAADLGPGPEAEDGTDDEPAGGSGTVGTVMAPTVATLVADLLDAPVPPRTEEQVEGAAG